MLRITKIEFSTLFLSARKERESVPRTDFGSYNLVETVRNENIDRTSKRMGGCTGRDAIHAGCDAGVMTRAGKREE